MLNVGVGNDRAGTAEQCKISRAQDTQVPIILRLAKSVPSLLLEWLGKGGCHCTERALRPILRLPEADQLAALQEPRERNSKGGAACERRRACLIAFRVAEKLRDTAGGLREEQPSPRT